MTAATIGADQRRTFQPVRRDSRHAGEREHLAWRPLGRTRQEGWRLVRELLKAARRFELANRAPGKENGPLGHIGLEVLEWLLHTADFRTGRLEPAIDTIAEETRRSRTAVVAALARLKAHGFLRWIRRTEPTDNQGEAGPQVRQITNAYGFWLDDLRDRCRSAWRSVTAALRSVPPPDCEADRRDQDLAATEAMLATVTAEQQARFIAGDDPLGDQLAALGRALDRSASSTGGQSPDEEDI